MARFLVDPGCVHNSSGQQGRSSYHHGDLPRVLRDTATQAILEVGPAAVSLRDLARRVASPTPPRPTTSAKKAGL
jgi:hypothetical protein